jgi:hypothetical protein
MTIALTEDIADQWPPSGSLDGLTAQLSLDRDQTRAHLFALASRRYLHAVEEPDLEADRLPRYALTDAGRAAVDRFLHRAARFLPGWPPAAPTRSDSRADEQRTTA